MQIQENIPLKDFTAFHIGGLARYFAEVGSNNDLLGVLEFASKNNLKIFVLGGGCNMLVSDAGFDGLVIRPKFIGVEKVNEDKDFVYLKVGAGEDWDKFVGYVVENNWWGIENLSYIPGLVGGVPMQNVGAYGMEAKDVVTLVEVYDLIEKKITEIKGEDCEFGYRESRFNKREKGRYVILSVLFKLNKAGTPNMKYPDVIKYFEERNIVNPTLKDMRDAIVFIRKNKLPDPAVVGNAGSCFKNLILNDADTALLLQKVKENTNQETVDKLLEIKNKLYSPSGFKIPTAFLVDQVCGLKGYELNGVKVHDKQPLVLVNNSGSATAKDVLALARHIMQVVYEKTGIKIVFEIELVGFKPEEIAEFRVG